MSKVLRYFDTGGFAEAIRYILHYTDQEFEDVRYEHKIWPVKEVKDAAPFGKLPIFEDGDRVLNQSIAIARYVAANTTLLPSDVWEQSQLDALVLTFYDFSKNVTNVLHAKTPEDKAEMKSKLQEEFWVFYFSRFEKILKANNGYFGGKLSWADFIFVGLFESWNLFLEEELEKGYPAISKLLETVYGLPRVKEYIEDRKPYKKSF